MPGDSLHADSVGDNGVKAPVAHASAQKAPEASTHCKRGFCCVFISGIREILKQHPLDKVERPRVVFQILPHGNHGRLCRPIYGIVKHACRDGGKGYPADAVLLGHTQRVPIAGREHFRLSLTASMPDRPDRMDHVLTGKVVALRDFRVARLAPTQLEALRPQPSASGTVDRPVDASPSQQRPVRGIHDRIDIRDFRDVPFDEANHGLFQFREHFVAFPPDVQGGARVELCVAGIDLHNPGGWADVVPVHATIVADCADHDDQLGLSRPFLRLWDIVVIQADMSIDRPAGVEPSALASRGASPIPDVHVVVPLPAFQAGDTGSNRICRQKQDRRGRA